MDAKKDSIFYEVGEALGAVVGVVLMVVLSIIIFVAPFVVLALGLGLIVVIFRWLTGI